MEQKKIAILIPVFNEEKTIVKVIREFNKILPEATIYVYDNNSIDNSYSLAIKEKCILRKEPKQGKGNVVRSMFRDIDADCYLMIDGDYTYSAKDAKKLCKLILEEKADMVIGDRLSSSYFKENKRLFHNFGNKLVRFLINFLFKGNIKDVLSGYRAFSYEFVKSFPALSKKFEIETEMTIFAINNNFKIYSIPVIYRDRVKGSCSKLSTIKDGIKILDTIKKYFKLYYPKKYYGILGFIFFIIWMLLYLFNFTLGYQLLISIIGIALFLLGSIIEVISIYNHQLIEIQLRLLRRKK